MGYTTFKEVGGAIQAAAELANEEPRCVAADIEAGLPALVDQVQAEAGVAEPRLAARALAQARGDVTRAVSLLAAWASTLPRRAHNSVTAGDLAVTRRITPAYREPQGGQYLGASLDYATRLLEIDDQLDEEDEAGRRSEAGGPEAEETEAREPIPRTFARALAGLEADGYVAARPRTRALDRTREAIEPGRERGAFQQLLAGAETGTMTAMAYMAQRGYASRQDPTLVELRQGEAPVGLRHPRSGRPVRIGAVAITTGEVVLYRGHDDHVDRRFTLGVGATLGCLERRAVAGALLDASCARARLDETRRRQPSDDEEFLTLALDGQEASGFLEHLKLPHHVTFTSDLDRIRAAREGEPIAVGGED